MARTEELNHGRRAFLQAGALAATAAAGASPGLAAQVKGTKPAELPRRKLGKTGVEVTMLEQGTVLGSGFERIMRLSFAGGVRVFDTAKYRSQQLRTGIP